MKETGELLKKQRESKNIGLNEVSIATKINIKVLRAIEEGDLNKLPAKTFLRGFIRSYAQYLKMDVEVVLAHFTKEVGGQTEAPKHNLIQTSGPIMTDDTASQSSSSNLSLIKKLSYAMGVFILVALIFYVKHLIDKYERESVQNKVAIEKSKEIEAKADQTQTQNELNLSQSVATEEKPDESKKSEPITPLTTTTSPTPPVENLTPAKPVTPEPSKPTVAALPAKPVVPPAPTPSHPPAIPNSTPKPAPSPLVAKPAEAPSAPSAAPAAPPVTPAPTVQTATEKPLEKKNNELILEALDKVDVAYTLENGKTNKVTLNPDQIHNIKAKGIIKISISNGGAVNVIYNGKDKGIPGAIGKPINLSYQ